MRYKHFLLTRFNIRIASMLTKKLDAIDISRDEEYLEERFRLFFDYTVPSIKGQTVKSFVWLVLFSDNTPDRFKERIRMLEDELDIFKPIFVKDTESADSLLNKELTKYETDICITSRVDNDDALALNFIETVREYVSKNADSRYALIFNNGYQYEEKNGIVSKYRFPKNHFSTLITPYEKEVDTILNYGHMDIQEKVNVVEIDNTSPLWLEVVHGTNVSNRMHTNGDSIVKDSDALQIFGIMSKNIRVPKSAKLYAYFNKPANAIRLIKQYGIKKTIAKVFEKIKKVFGS